MNTFRCAECAAVASTITASGQLIYEGNASCQVKTFAFSFFFEHTALKKKSYFYTSLHYFPSEILCRDQVLFLSSYVVNLDLTLTPGVNVTIYDILNWGTGLLLKVW